MVYSVDMGGGKSQCLILEDVSPTLTTTHYGEPVVAYDNRIRCLQFKSHGEVARTLAVERADAERQPCVVITDENIYSTDRLYDKDGESDVFGHMPNLANGNR